MRLSEWKRRFQKRPAVFSHVLDAFALLKDGAGGRLMSMVSEIGLLPHPVLHDVLALKKSLNHKAVREVLYHCDLPTQYQNLSVIEKALKSRKRQEQRQLVDHARVHAPSPASATIGSDDAGK